MPSTRPIQAQRGSTRHKLVNAAAPLTRLPSGRRRCNRASAASRVRSAPRSAGPQRYDDAALTAIAGLSPAIACECPRHLAELLMQLSNFETYSADCANRSPADAQLHAYLQRVAGASRGLFEAALERVARHEGLTLS